MELSSSYEETFYKLQCIEGLLTKSILIIQQTKYFHQKKLHKIPNDGLENCNVHPYSDKDEK